MENTVLKNNSNITNVVGLNNNSLYNAIEAFLSVKKLSSENTETNYRGAIRDFFMYVFGKNYNELTWNDVLSEENINYNTIRQYQLYLADKNSNKTVNTKITSIKSLFRDLRRSNKNINLEAFDVERLPETKNHYGKFSKDEIDGLIEYAKSRNKGNIQSLYLDTLYVTAIRREAILNLTWDEIYQVYDNSIGKMVWMINTIDKGTKETGTAIPDELYEKLLTLKNSNSNRVFNINIKTIEKTLEDFCNENNINKKQRNLTLHSVKHTSVVKVIRKFKDDKTTQHHAHHQNYQTTMNNYAEDMVSPSQQASYRFYEEIDVSILEKLSKDELIALISRASDSVKKELINMI